MNKQTRESDEAYFQGVLRAAFISARKVESFKDSTLFVVEFADGKERDVTLHFDDNE